MILPPIGVGVFFSFFVISPLLYIYIYIDFPLSPAVA